MNRLILSALGLAALSAPASAGDISSAYSDLNADKDCTVLAVAAEGDGDWANLVCAGYRGYPVFLYAGDLRESLFYGFPPAGDLAPAWESFSAFNAAGGKIEWRIETTDGLAIPFATIHRRKVSDSVESDSTTEVLVVSKVGQPHAREGCVVGLVLASGHPDANQTAREVADDHARNFACGTDRPVSIGEPMPDFRRSN